MKGWNIVLFHEEFIVTFVLDGSRLLANRKLIVFLPVFKPASKDLLSCFELFLYFLLLHLMLFAFVVEGPSNIDLYHLIAEFRLHVLAVLSEYFLDVLKVFFIRFRQIGFGKFLHHQSEVGG